MKQSDVSESIVFLTRYFIKIPRVRKQNYIEPLKHANDQQYATPFKMCFNLSKALAEKHLTDPVINASDEPTLFKPHMPMPRLRFWFVRLR